MIYIWSSSCHCRPIISCSSKIQNGLPFWCRLTQVVIEKRPLNDVAVVVVGSLLIIIMAALWNRADHYIFAVVSFFFFLFSLPNLRGRRLDVYYTSTHGVALVQI